MCTEGQLSYLMTTEVPQQEAAGYSEDWGQALTSMQYSVGCVEDCVALLWDCWCYFRCTLAPACSGEPDSKPAAEAASASTGAGPPLLLLLLRQGPPRRKPAARIDAAAPDRLGPAASAAGLNSIGCCCGSSSSGDGSKDACDEARPSVMAAS